METVSLTTFYRPPKLAFIVKGKAQAKKAMEMCTILWGGKYNEIYENEHLSKIKDHMIYDFVVSFDDKTSIPKEIADKALLFDELIVNSDYFNGTYFLDTLGIYQHLSINKIKAALYKPKSGTLLDIYRYGNFPKFTPVQYSKAYEGLLSPEVKFSIPKVARKREKVYFPLDLTMHDLIPPSGDSDKNYGIIIFLGDPNNYKDIVTVWTLRARGNRIRFVDRRNTSSAIRDIARMIDRLIKNAHKEANRNTSLPSIFLTSRNISKDEQILKTLAESLKIARCNDVTWFLQKPKHVFKLFSKTESKRQMGFINDRQLSFDLDFPVYAKERDIQFNRLGVCFELPSLYGAIATKYLQGIPPIENAEQCLFIGSHKKMERLMNNTVTLFDDTFGSTQNVWMNSPWEFWRSFYWSKDIAIKPSHAGHNLTNIITSLGGIDPGCRFLKHPAVQTIIHLLQDDHPIKITELKQKTDKLFRKKINGINITKDNIYSELCLRGIIRQGHRLLCEYCQNSSWYSITDIGDHWICRFCGKQSRTTSLHHADLEFKLGGLLQLPGKAQGAFTSLLTLWRFNHLFHLDHINFIPSFEMFTNNSKSAFLECDLLITVGGRYDGASEIILVESKSGNDLRQEDVDKIIKLKNIIGVSCFKCFATTKNEFSKSEIDMLVNLYESDPRLILLTSEELAPYELWDIFPLYESKYITSLYDLSMATVQKHLKPKELIRLTRVI